MFKSLGFNTVSYDTVKVWILTFKAGNLDIEDEPRSGRSVEVDCDPLKQIIDQDINVSTRTMALDFDVGQNTIVPHKLTADDKSKR
ncbi:UNVERIFIED_CONTAM: Histone-lysine N-methyltransferase SETMAR [Trichonephila clavipes]